MKSKTSFFNSGIILSNLKRYSWVSILWSVLLFLSVPLNMMNFNPDNYNEYSSFSYRTNDFHMFTYNLGGIFSNLMLCFAPVLIAVLVFSYLHSPRSATTMHGLPFSRIRLFTNSYLSGLILMAIPFIINGIIVFIVNLTCPVGEYLTYITIFKWLYISACLGVVIYSLAVFVGMFTGNVFAHVIFTYIVHFLAYGIYIGIVEMCCSLLYGYTYPNTPLFFRYFPMNQVSNDCSPFAWAYIIAAAILSLLAFLAYRKRPTESAGDIVSFKFLRPVFKYGTTFCFALFGYIILESAFDNDTVAFALLGGAIGYVAAQMLLSKTWRVWSAWKGFVMSMAVVALALVLVKADVMGYTTRIPNINTVKNASIYLPGTATDGYVKTEDKELIVKISDIHKDLIENNPYRTNNNMDKHHISITIVYNTKFGEMRREYRFYSEDFAQDINELFKNDDFCTQAFKILNTDTEQINSITITRYDDYEEYRLNDSQKIEEFMSIYIPEFETQVKADAILANEKDFDALYSVRVEIEPTKAEAEKYANENAITRSNAYSQLARSYSYDIYNAKQSIYENSISWIESYITSIDGRQ